MIKGCYRKPYFTNQYSEMTQRFLTLPKCCFKEGGWFGSSLCNYRILQAASFDDIKILSFIGKMMVRFGW